MVAQLFPLPCYRKKRNQCCHFSWGKKKSKRNQTEQIQANSATHFSGLLKINMEKILKAEPQAANFCICFLFQLKILSITSQQISTLLAVSPHHRHHLVFSSRREQVSFCTVGKSCRSTWKGKFPAQESLKPQGSRKTSAAVG